MFYIGLHCPHHANIFSRSFISINRLRRRREPIKCPSVIIDSGAFTELATYGKYRHEVSDYARTLRRLHEEHVVNIEIAVSQDYMCEDFMLEKTGLSLENHQFLTISRYDLLLKENLPFPIMPVLQGYAPATYVSHLMQYGSRLAQDMWIGVGSVCKRNRNAESIVEVLEEIHSIRPDLRLHGFGIKSTSLRNKRVSELLYSADSMAWSFSARLEGRDRNSAIEAAVFAMKMNKFFPSSSPVLIS